MGREQFYKLESALRVLMLHMLKWDNQPDRRGRSWSATIREQRLRVADLLADNPGLRPRIPEASVRAYRRARLRAVKETDLEESRFPESCPYSSDDITRASFQCRTMPNYIAVIHGPRQLRSGGRACGSRCSVQAAGSDATSSMRRVPHSIMSSRSCAIRSARSCPMT